MFLVYLKHDFWCVGVIHPELHVKLTQQLGKQVWVILNSILETSKLLNKVKRIKIIDWRGGLRL